MLVFFVDFYFVFSRPAAA